MAAQLSAAIAGEGKKEANRKWIAEISLDSLSAI